MKKIIIANWKMNPPSVKEAEIIFKDIALLSKSYKNSQIIICPPFPFLSIGKKNKKIKLGAQNVSSQWEGSFTGEVSPSMLRNFQVEYVIIGHSERRALGETNQIVNKKILNSLKAKLQPILCIGESVRDPEGIYLSFIKHQIEECLSEIPKSQLKNIIIAYEPIWAVGKGAIREATVEEFIEMKIYIKKLVADLYDAKVANSLKIIYGGSVNSFNAESFIKVGNADGLLVGRDSLTPKKFSAIVKIAELYEIN